MKTFVLDTNVLLSDSSAAFNFEKSVVIIPLIALEELDRHKDRQDEVGKMARDFSRSLSSLIKKHKDLSKGIKLENGSVLKVLSIKDVEGNYSVPQELNDKSGDNIIIAFCKAYQSVDRNLTLISKDLLLRLKAEALGIPCEDYKKENVVKSIDSLYEGQKTISVSKNDLTKFYNGELFLSDLKNEEKLFPNEFIILKTEDGSSGLARFMNKNIPFKKVDDKKSAWNIKAKNKEQSFALDLLYDDNVKLVTLSGVAGTGKTLLTIAAGLDQVVGSKKYNKLIISRILQPLGEKIGYLPGSKEEKVEPWLTSFKDNLEFLLHEDFKLAEEKGAIKNKKLKESIMLQQYFEQGTIEMEVPTYIRGRSISNSFIIFDESQNITLHELKTILTRVSVGSKIILIGDIFQIDNTHVDSISNGLTIAIEKFKDYEIAGHVTMMKGERSELATISGKIL